jgi:hypothetical protein
LMTSRKPPVTPTLAVNPGRSMAILPDTDQARRQGTGRCEERYCERKDDRWVRSSHLSRGIEGFWNHDVRAWQGGVVYQKTWAKRPPILPWL